MPSGSSAKRTKAKTDTPAVEASSGNVFADLELPNPDLALAKAELVRHLRQLIEEPGLTQAQTASVLRLPQPKVSGLLRGRVEGFSIDRLFRLLNALGQRVEITLYPADPASGVAGRRVVVTR